MTEFIKVLFVFALINLTLVMLPPTMVSNDIYYIGLCILGAGFVISNYDSKG